MKAADGWVVRSVQAPQRGQAQIEGIRRNLNGLALDGAKNRSGYEDPMAEWLRIVPAVGPHVAFVVQPPASPRQPGAMGVACGQPAEHLCTDDGAAMLMAFYADVDQPIVFSRLGSEVGQHAAWSRTAVRWKLDAVHEAPPRWAGLRRADEGALELQDLRVLKHGRTPAADAVAGYRGRSGRGVHDVYVTWSRVGLPEVAR